MSRTAAIVLGVFALLLAASAPKWVEWLDASDVMVIQYPRGELSAFTEPGPWAQWWGTMTKYPRTSFYEFDNDKAICKSQKDNKGNTPIRVRFAEGGHGHICGTIRWEMPADPKMLFEIQKDFGSHHAVESSLVAPALVNAIYLSGQTMTSTESAAERRSELLHYIEDQLKNGVYKTTTKQERSIDPLTKQDRTITRVEIVKGKDGLPERQNVSAIGVYGVKLVQTSISEIPYEPEVEAQIKAQQGAKADVQVAIAKAIKAEQQSRTEVEEGKARAAKAEWDQKTLAAKAIELARQEKTVAETHAAKEKEVAKLEKEAAEFIKQKEILLGQGESERRKLVMQADGALEKKLQAYVDVNKAYAEAISGYAGAWVPTTVMGNSGGGVNGAQALIELFTAKAAKDLALDTKPGGK